MTLDSPLTELRGVGVAVARNFTKLGLTSVSQLIDYYPRRYEDYSQVTDTLNLKPGPVSIEASIESCRGRYVRRGLHITEAVAVDAQGSVRLLWFNQPYRATAIKAGHAYFISGNYELSYRHFAIMNPSLELASEFPINTARIVPVYRETKGLNSRQIRLAIRECLSLIARLPESLPEWMIREASLVCRAEAMRAIHFPETAAQLQAAERRLGFEEILHLTLASLLNKQENQQGKGLSISYQPEIAIRFTATLPFSLTDAQKLAVMRIYKDMEKAEPMNRLLEGDVGSGKTLVAAMAAVMALAQGYQVALMAPTEILARQHAATVAKLFQPLGLDSTVTLLVGSLSAAQKKVAHRAITSGQARFIVGTQALIQEPVSMSTLALVIIDEQHRFGVDQRKALQAKADHMPHVLSLTATPIPRSLALTLYGELDISLLADKPYGRQPIITKIVSPNSRAALYAQIDTILSTGRQMFVVCPLIADSSLLQVNSVETVYEQLSKKDFKHKRVGLLHGKMKAAEKTAVMQKFIDHTLDILVSTTVIEVGVDVPNASIMLLEAAERFGLAQIHQLRGRVGRGRDQGYCYLMLSDSKPPTKRLRAIESSNDGFRLAELDLELRGPGAIYGSLQHGELDLRIAKLTDIKLIASARSAAQSMLDEHQDLLQYKELAANVARLRTVTNLN